MTRLLATIRGTSLPVTNSLKTKVKGGQGGLNSEHCGRPNHISAQLAALGDAADVNSNAGCAYEGCGCNCVGLRGRLWGRNS
jgi:hypothetical protein